MRYGLPRRLKAAVAVLLAWMLLGCATPQTTGLLQERRADLPPRAELSAVPFFAQEMHQCGPAALATALGASGARISPEELVPQVYLPGREGSLQVELLAAARRQGRLAVELQPELHDVLAEIAAGTPVLVLQNLALSWYPKWHYAVAVGYDLKEGQIVLRSGRNRREVMPLTTFEHTWARADRWATVVLPPGRLPRTVPEGAYAKAALALEQSGQIKAARSAYNAALTRWPRSLPALVGLGNTDYAQRDLKGAEQAFRRAVTAHPESDAALNNLAQVLADQGRVPEALEMARRAVGLAGPNKNVAEQTLHEIAARQKARGVTL